MANLFFRWILGKFNLSKYSFALSRMKITFGNFFFIYIFDIFLLYFCDIVLNIYFQINEFDQNVPTIYICHIILNDFIIIKTKCLHIILYHTG